MRKITYSVVPVTSYVLRRSVEADRRGIVSVHHEDVGTFLTKAEAEVFGDTLKALDDQPGKDAGKRWAYGMMADEQA